MRCQWCGNVNDLEAHECAYCKKDLLAGQDTQDAVDRLEALSAPDLEVICPACGFSNFVGTEFCSLCQTRLHSDASWPTHLSARTSTDTLGRGRTRLALIVAMFVVSAALLGAAILSTPRTSPTANLTGTGRGSDSARYVPYDSSYRSVPSRAGQLPAYQYNPTTQQYAQPGQTFDANGYPRDSYLMQGQTYTWTGQSAPQGYRSGSNAQSPVRGYPYTSTGQPSVRIYPYTTTSPGR